MSLTLFDYHSGDQISPKCPVDTENQDMSCSYHLKPIGLPLNRVECENTEPFYEVCQKKHYMERTTLGGASYAEVPGGARHPLEPTPWSRGSAPDDHARCSSSIN